MAVLECCNESECSQDGKKVATVSRSSVESAESTSCVECLKAPGEFAATTSYVESSMSSSWEAPSISSDRSGIKGKKEAGQVCATIVSVEQVRNAAVSFPDGRVDVMGKRLGDGSVNKACLSGCLLNARPQEPGGSFHLMTLKLADPTPEIRLKALRTVHVFIVKNMMSMEVLHQSAEPLCRNLLEWFNLPNPSHQDTVLSILIKLAQNSYTRRWLLEIGALEFMEQFRAHNIEDFLPHVTLLISLLSQGDVSDISKSPSGCVLPDEVLNPVEVVSPFSRPWLHSIRPRQFISSPEGKFSCGGAFSFSPESHDVGPTLPFIDLEPADIQYLFELNELLHDVQHPQVIEKALLDLRETVVVDFHPEAILQSQPIVENVLALIHALKYSNLVPLALDFLCSLIRRIKAALSLSYEAAFQVHPGAGSITVSDDCNDLETNGNGIAYPPTIARNYPVSKQQDINPSQRVPGNSATEGRLLLHLERTLHMITLQLIKLLTETEYHQAIFKVLYELLLLLKPPEDKQLSSKTHYMQYFGALADVVGALSGDSDDLGVLCLGSIMQNGAHNDETWQLRCIPILTVLSYTADMLSLLKPAEAAGLLPFELIKALKALTSDIILAECNFGIHTRILPYFEFLDPDYHSSYCFAHDAYGALSAAERTVNAALDCINVGTTSSKTLATTDSATLANYMSDALPYLVDFEDENLVKKFISVAINLLEIEVDSFQTRRDRSLGKLKRMKRNFGMRSDPGDLGAQNLWLVFNADIERKITQTSHLIVDLISHSSANIRRTTYEALLGVSSSERARTDQWCALNKIGFGDACEDHRDRRIKDNSNDAPVPLSPASILHNILLRGSKVMGELLTVGIHDAATCKLSAELLLHHVEFLGLHARIEMIPALSWIACSASLTRECSTADKVANHLLYAMEFKRSSAEAEKTNYDSPMAAWTEISFFLRPLFCLSSSERCKAAQELLEALQICFKSEGYVPWWITQSEICARRKDPSHYMHDPFRYFILFDREEYLRCSQSETFVNVLQDTEDWQGFEFPGNKNQKLTQLLDLIKSSTPTCEIARKCAVEQLIKMPLDKLLQVTEGDIDLLETLVNEIVSWMKLGYQRSEESQSMNFVTDKVTMSSVMIMGEGCLSLLTRLVTAHELSKIRCWLISNPKQRVEPLLPLVFHPITSVRKDMAFLLCFLLFSADLLYSDLRKVLPAGDQLYPRSCIQMQYPSTENVQLFVPVTFMCCYRFPCGAIPVDLRRAVSAAGTSRCDAFVHHMVAQLKLLDGGFETLAQFHEIKSSIASVVGLSPLELQALSCICALSADYVIKNLLQHLTYPKDYDEETRQLVELAAQCSRHTEAAIILARSNWMAPFERFFRTSPTSEHKFALLLKVLHVVELMMGTNCMTSSGLIFLSTSLRDTLLPFLVERLSTGFGNTVQTAVQNTLLVPNQVELSILHLIFNVLLSAENHVDKEVFGRVLIVLMEGSSLLSVFHAIIMKIQSAPYTFSVLAVQSISLLAKGMALDFGCKGSPNLFSFTKLKFCDQTRAAEPIQEQATTGCIKNGIAQLIAPLIKHIARFYNSDTASLQSKQLVREIVYCLWSITSSISPFLWEELWASTGVTHWLSRVVTDQEGTVRGMAFGILAMLASPVTPMTQNMLLKNWPEVGMVAVRSVLNTQECYAVRQESLRFILASNFWTAACRFNIADLDGDATMQIDFEELDPFGISAALHKCKFWAAFPLMLTEENGTPGFYRVFLEVVRRLTLTDMEFVQKQFVQVPSIFDALLRHLGCPTSDQGSISSHLELCEKGRESYVTAWEKRHMHSRIQLADRYGVTAQIAEILELLACDGDLILKDVVSSSTVVAALICAFCYCGIDNEDMECSLLSYGAFKGPKQRILEEQVKPVRKAITEYERAEAIFHVATTLNTLLQESYMHDRNNDISPQQVFVRGDVSEPSDVSLDDSMVSTTGCDQCSSDMNVAQILSTSGRIICTAAANVLPAFPSVHLLRRAINANNDDNMQGSLGIDNYPMIWRMWLSVSALLATLLSQEDKAELVLCEEYEACGAVNNEGGAKHYSNQIVSALFEVLEDLYAESRKARASRDFRFLEHLVFILSAVGRALQNIITFSPRAKLFAVQSLIPRKLITLAHDSYSILAYGYIKRFQNVVRRSKKGRWAIWKARSFSNRRPQWNSSWHTKSLSGLQPLSPTKRLAGRTNFVEEPLEKKCNSSKAFGCGGVRQFRALVFEELLLSIRLLEHLVYKSAEAAEACVDSGVFSLIGSVWDFAHENEDLLSELLGLLSNLAAQCDQAKVVITKVGLMDSVVDFVLLPNVSTVCYGVALSLLQTLMTRAEPRARFLHKQWLGGLISQLKNHISTNNVLRQHLLLQLLVNLSAFPHGQMMVTKHLSSDGQFDLVLDVVELGKEPAASSALFLLRNLSFCPECQIHFLSNERTVPLLLLSLRSPSLQGRAYSSSAIWELLFQGNRFISVFKPSASVLLAAEMAARADLSKLDSLADRGLRPNCQLANSLRQLEQGLYAINRLMGEDFVDSEDFPGDADELWKKAKEAM